MANTVKLFQLTQIYFQTVGIYPTKPNQKYSYNMTTFWILLSMLVIFFSTVAFFFLKAETIDEYSDTFYVSCSVVAFFIFFLINIWKMSTFLQLIGIYEEFYRKSKWNSHVLQLKSHCIQNKFRFCRNI